MVTGTTLYRVDLTTNKLTIIINILDILAGPINAIGYNTLDNYIYGIMADPLLGGSGSQLVKIASDGTYKRLSARIENNKALYVGDIDSTGRLFVSDGGSNWWQFDVNPSSSTYGTLVGSGASSNVPSVTFNDWAYIPGGGDYLYAVPPSIVNLLSASTTMYRWSMTTKTWSTYRTYSISSLAQLVSSVYGAVYASADGNLYAGDNVLGAIYKFPVVAAGTSASLVSSAAILNVVNDGARCVKSANI